MPAAGAGCLARPSDCQVDGSNTGSGRTISQTMTVPAASNRPLGNPIVTRDAPKSEVQLPAVPAKPGWVTRFKESPHGEALAIWARGTSNTVAVLAPSAVMGSAGLAIGSINAVGDSSGTGFVVGVLAGVVAAAVKGIQGSGPSLYRAEGSKFPWLASARDTLAYVAAPAIACGVVTAELATGGAGVVAAVVGGLVGGGIGITADEIRVKRSRR